MEGINPKDEPIIEHIDQTLNEYDRQRVIEESVWDDMVGLVKSGDIDIETAARRYAEWFTKRHERYINPD